MRKHFAIALLGASLIAAWPVNDHGQDAAPEGEIFVGGSKIWTHAPSDHFDTHGWGGSITGNFNRFVGVEADLFKYSDIPEFPPAYSNHYTFLFGPHFAYRGVPRLTPFAHVLVGGTHGSQYILPPYPPGVIEYTSSDLRGGTAFTVALGGGLDVKAWRFVWIRVIQADYLRASFPNNAQNSLRLSFGVTFHLGSLRK